jgi:hypothetical protein
MKLKKTKRNKYFCVFSILLLTATLLFSGCAKQRQNQNQTLAAQYISAKYGSNFRIVNYRGPVNSASGIRPARIDVEQNGVTYYVLVENGAVISDNYSEKYGAKIVLDMIHANLDSSGKRAGLANRSGKELCDLCITDPNLLAMDVDLSHVSDYAGLLQTTDSAGAIPTAYIHYQIIDVTDLKSESWMYDYYLACQVELQYYCLSFECSGPDLPKRYIADFESGAVKSPTLTQDEFWSRFH